MGRAVLLGINHGHWSDDEEEKKEKCGSTGAAAYVPYLMDWILETIAKN